MTTSGTTSFTLNVDEICRDAWDLLGNVPALGYDPVVARRCLNLLLLDWQNDGINLWALEEKVLPLVSGSATYTLSADTFDVYYGVVRTSSAATDYQMERMSYSDYLALPRKQQNGRPTRYLIDRNVDSVEATFWQVPNSDDYSFKYYKIRRLQDITAATETVDVPYRFLPCITAGLAYYIAQRKPVGNDVLMRVKALYDEQYMRAKEEDRERADWKVVPGRAR